MIIFSFIYFFSAQFSSSKISVDSGEILQLQVSLAPTVYGELNDFIV